MTPAAAIMPAFPPAARAGVRFVSPRPHEVQGDDQQRQGAEKLQERQAHQRARHQGQDQAEEDGAGRAKKAALRACSGGSWRQASAITRALSPLSSRSRNRICSNTPKVDAATAPSMEC